MFQDMFTVKNDLLLQTPFETWPEVTSVGNWYLMVMDELIMELEVHVRAKNVTKKVTIMLL